MKIKKKNALKFKAKIMATERQHKGSFISMLCNPPATDLELQNKMP